MNSVNMSNSPQELSSSSSAPLPDEGAPDFKKKEDNDLNDAKPTSSTDADTSTKSTEQPSDDPISSTSCDTDQIRSHVTSVEEDVELEISMSQQPCGEITENVDDLVNDLETLLGESTDSFNITFKSTRSDESFRAETNVEGKGSVESTEIEVESRKDDIEVIDAIEQPAPELPECKELNEIEEFVVSSLPSNADADLPKVVQDEPGDGKIDGVDKVAEEVETILETNEQTDVEATSCSGVSNQNCDLEADKIHIGNEDNEDRINSANVAAEAAVREVVENTTESEKTPCEGKLDELYVQAGSPEGDEIIGKVSEEVVESAGFIEQIAEEGIKQIEDQLDEICDIENIPGKPELNVETETNLSTTQKDDSIKDVDAEGEDENVTQIIVDANVDEIQHEARDKSSADLDTADIEHSESLKTIQDETLEGLESKPSDEFVVDNKNEDATSVMESVDEIGEGSFADAKQDQDDSVDGKTSSALLMVSQAKDDLDNDKSDEAGKSVMEPIKGASEFINAAEETQSTGAESTEGSKKEQCVKEVTSPVKEMLDRCENIEKSPIDSSSVEVETAVMEKQEDGEQETFNVEDNHDAEKKSENVASMDKENNQTVKDGDVVSDKQITAEDSISNREELRIESSGVKELLKVTVDSVAVKASSFEKSKKVLRTEDMLSAGENASETAENSTLSVDASDKNKETSGENSNEVQAASDVTILSVLESADVGEASVDVNIQFCEATDQDVFPDKVIESVSENVEIIAAAEDFSETIDTAIIAAAAVAENFEAEIGDENPVSLSDTINQDDTSSAAHEEVSFGAHQEMIADPEANLETIMAVANLQNDPITEIEANTLSEREIQEMETLRLAVDSITDTRDSYHEEIINYIPNAIQVPSAVAELGQRAEIEIVAVQNSTSRVEVKGRVLDADAQISNVVTVNDKHGIKINEPLTISIDEPEKKVNTYSPKITIKPIRMPDEEVTTTSESELNKGSLKMTITKQSDTLHSILKASDDQDDPLESDVNEAPIPKLIIKSKMQLVDRQHSPKSTRCVSKHHSPPIAAQGRKSPEIMLKADASPLKITIKSVSKVLKGEGEMKPQSPRITIKPIPKPAPESESGSVPKVTIRAVKRQDDLEEDERSSPKITIKPVVRPSESDFPRTASPKLTIKPLKKPDVDALRGVKRHEEFDEDERSSPKVIIKPIVKPDEAEVKVTIKPIKKTEQFDQKAQDEQERSKSPKVIIKPVIKPPETEVEPAQVSPRITIKPVKRLDAEVGEHESEILDEEGAKGRIVLKINKGNIPNQPKDSKKREFSCEDEKSEKLAKIKLKFSKEGGHPHIVQDENNKRMKKDHEYAAKDPENSFNKRHSDERVAEKNKRFRGNAREDETKISPVVISDDSTSHHSTDCAAVDATYASKMSELTAKTFHVEVPPTIVNVATVTTPTPKKRGRPRKIPLQPREEFTPIPSASTSIIGDPVSGTSQSESETPPTGGRPKRSCRGQNVMATLGIKPRKPRGRGRGSKVNMGDRLPPTIDTPPEHTPKARGRPRLVPKVEETPKRPEDAAAGAEPKPENRGEATIPSDNSKNEPVPFLGERSIKNESDTNIKKEPDPGISEEMSALQQQKAEKRMKQLAQLRAKMAEKRLKAAEIKKKRVECAKLKRMSRLQAKENEEKARKQLFINRAFNPSFAMHNPKPAEAEDGGRETPLPEQAANQSILGGGDMVVVDEETRMSADRESRGATPAKNVMASETVAEESQSSLQSTGTTESGSGRTGGSSSKPTKPRLEVHQETDTISITVDQLAEYSWNGDGPFMLQEQVAQFLGIKSFKRKYPNILRRPVDMQERDFIRESGMATEALCDMGLTAVSGQDILDIMYADFQDKYEEYCRCQRERQARELANKQKALSQQAKGHERRDIMEQAIQSAAQWNQQFNRDRRDHRKASMDLQSLTVHYPKDRLKNIDKDKVGNFPVALVPGQFTDFYKEFTPTELNNLPLNTMCYDEVRGGSVEASEDSGSSSDSDSSTSSSTSSEYSSDEDCNLCATKTHIKKAIVTKASG